MITKDTRSPSVTRDLPKDKASGKQVPTQIGATEEDIEVILPLKCESPVLSRAMEEEILAHPVDAQNFTILESVLNLEKEGNTNDISLSF